tara:strand:+ start:14 stop:2452 length:2439 start_codon:yes stop_codon:yes gene_type:complete
MSRYLQEYQGRNMPPDDRKGDFKEEMFLGVNDRLPPEKLGEGFLSEGRNLTIIENRLSTRKGMLEMPVTASSSLLNNIISYWRLDETSSVKTDQVATTGNDLTDDTNTTVTSGLYDFMTDFDAASSQYLSIADNSSFVVSAFTFAGAFILDSTSASRYLFSKHDSSSVREFAFWYDSSVSRMKFSAWNATGTQGSLLAESNNVINAENDDILELEDTIGNAVWGSAPNTGQLYFFTCWYDPARNTMNLSIDDETPVEGTLNGVIADTAAGFKVGAANSTASDFWDGQIGGLGYWSRIHTSQEITSLYGNSSGLDYPFGSHTAEVFATTVFSDPNNVSSEYILIAQGESMLAIKAPGTLRVIDYPTDEEVTLEATLVQAFDKVLLMRNPKDGSPLVWDGDFDNAMTVASTSGSPASIDSVDYATYFRNRLYAIVDKDTVRYSDLIDLVNWQAVVNEFTFNSGSDDQLVAVVPRDDNTLIVFKDQSIYAITGISSTLSAPLLQLLTEEYGLVSRLAAKRVGDDTIFLSERGLFTVNQTLENKLRAESKPITFDISKTFNKINKKYLSKAAMGFNNNELWLAVPWESSTVNNKVLVYNTITKTWFGRYDLPDDDLAIHSFINADYFGDRRLFIVDKSGRVFLCQEGTHDIANNKVVDIPFYAKTRSMFYGGIRGKHLTRAYIDYESFSPKLSVNVIPPGHNESVAIMTDETKNRSKYLTAHTADYDTDNDNDDFDTPYREDYSIVLDPDSTDPGFDLQTDGVSIEALAHHEFKRNLPKINTPHAQVEITNTTGTIEINSIGVEGSLGHSYTYQVD